MGREGRGVELREKSIRVNFTLDGKWQRVRLPLPPTPANERYAEKLVDRVRKAVARGTFEWADYFPDSPQAKKTKPAHSFGEWCDLWLKTKGRLAKNTLAQYRNALEIWKELLGKDKPMEQLTHAVIAAAVGDHPWKSAKLLNNYLIPLRGVFALAGRELNLARDPMEGIENSKHQPPPPDPLSLTEMADILSYMRQNFDPRVHAYFAFAFATGLRPEEMIVLRWGDVDWNHQTIRVERARTKNEVKDLKTYNARDVDLVQLAREALLVMKPWTQLGGETKEDELMGRYVFQNPVTNRPWNDERSQRDHYWAPTLRRLGIRHRRAYQTRHTYAATALMAGANPAYIARQMGHKNAKMLFTVYAKWIDGADRGRERAKIEAALKKENPAQGRAISHKSPARS
ncbi:tyrosine-type recombinase/integrase [Xenophilus sp. Marseille-Q4582]|uniref:tyrosine-type recombinase/integrase n=1 Tax=Xenophilus sp. Marseille-Q4582 TaxID=2866600 RepID=UPI001CE4A3A4|nr:tyrosine-type recombinase/integrase [Xenophilus sp. Marseille-Q4582]